MRRGQSKERKKTAALNPEVTRHSCQLRLYARDFVHAHPVSLCVCLCACFFCVYPTRVGRGCRAPQQQQQQQLEAPEENKGNQKETRAGAVAFPLVRMYCGVHLSS